MRCNNIQVWFFRTFLLLILVFPFRVFAQIPLVRSIEVIDSEEEMPIRMVPVCETEQRLRKKYSTYDVKEQVLELLKEDSTFTCTGIRGTTRTSGKRAVIQSILTEKRDEAFPELIKVVKKEKGEKSALAIEIIQHADDKLLREYRDLFIKKSASKHVGERNRSLYILQRIRDEHIERAIVKRWNAMSKREVEKLSDSYSLRTIFELMMYGVKDVELLEASILFTLREKELSPTALAEFFRALDSFVMREHNTEIDQEVRAVLMETKDEMVAEQAAEVLSESRTNEAKNALIEALDLKDETKRAMAASHLISRYDFKIDEDTVLLARILSDDSRKVIDYVYSPLTWKKPDAAQSAIIVKCLLNELNTSDISVPFKVFLMMNFYAYLDESHRESLKLNVPTLVLNTIESALANSEYDRISHSATTRVFEKIYGHKEMKMTHLEFWREQLER